MKRWEYVTADVTRSIHELDELGAEGWELVSVVAEPAIEGQRASVVAYFRRPLAERTPE